MCKHEEKQCPRCSKAFECKVGNIGECQCSGVQLSIEKRAFIETRYNDCLCINCLKELKNRYVFFKEKMYWK